MLRWGSKLHHQHPTTAPTKLRKKSGKNEIALNRIWSIIVNLNVLVPRFMFAVNLNCKPELTELLYYAAGLSIQLYAWVNPMYIVYTIKVETIENISYQDYTHRTPHEGPTCQAKRLDEREGEIGFVNIFHQNPITFYTSNFLYPFLVPIYYFPLAYTYFPLHIHCPHNSRHFFWKDNNWYYYLWKEKKDVY